MNGRIRWNIWWRRWGAYLSCAASIGSLLAGFAWEDYQRFQTMFVRNEVGDLSIKLLLDPQSRVIPNR